MTDPAPTAGVRGLGTSPDPAHPRPELSALPRQAVSAAERAALDAAQKRLELARMNDQIHRHQLAASRLTFGRELRCNIQPPLFPNPNRPGSPGSHRENNLGIDTAPPARQLPQRPAQGGAKPFHPSIEAAITTTLKEVDSPAWLTRQVLPFAEERLKTKLLEVARQKAAGEGRTRRIHCIRADRIKRDLAVFRVLAWGAFKYLDVQGQKTRAKFYTSVCYFTVLDVLPVLTGLGTTACEEAVADLRACGLIATRRDYQPATFRKRAEHDDQSDTEYTMQAVTGVWLAVLVKPERTHLRAMVLSSELPEAPPRDLLADRKAGRTAYQLRQEAKEQKAGESIPSQGGKLNLDTLLTWALPISELLKSVKKDSPAFFRETWNDFDEIRQAVAAASMERPQRRREVVMQAAQVIGKVLNDKNPVSIKGYCRMIWRGLAGEMQQRPALQGLLDAIDRTLTFRRESETDMRPLRAPGAYLRAVLQESGWMEREYRAA